MNDKNKKNYIFMGITIALLVAILIVGVLILTKPKPITKDIIKETVQSAAEIEEEAEVAKFKAMIDEYPANHRGKYPTTLKDISEEQILPLLNGLKCEFEGRGLNFKYDCTYKDVNNKLKTIHN